MADTYVLSYKCSNCECEFNLEIPKGTLAPQEPPCENCGVGPCERVRPGNAAQQTFEPRPAQKITAAAPEAPLENLSAEEKAKQVRDSLTEAHSANDLKPQGDPTKRYILIGCNIINKRKETIYVKASEKSFDADVKAQYSGKVELEQFLARIKMNPQTLLDLYGFKEEECYFLETLDRRWEHKRRVLPDLPAFPALVDGDYAGYKKQMGIIEE